MEPIHEALPDQDAARLVNKHIKGYFMVGGAQVLLTLVMVAVSFIPFRSWGTSIVTTLAVATLNGATVASISMHLKSEKWTIYRFLLITVVLALGMFLLTALAFSDRLHLN